MGIFTDEAEGYFEFNHMDCRLSPLFNMVLGKSRHIHMIGMLP